MATMALRKTPISGKKSAKLKRSIHNGEPPMIANRALVSFLFIVCNIRRFTRAIGHETIVDICSLNQSAVA